jgi:hypothetical protein
VEFNYEEAIRKFENTEAALREKAVSIELGHNFDRF